MGPHDYDCITIAAFTDMNAYNGVDYGSLFEKHWGDKMQEVFKRTENSRDEIGNGIWEVAASVGGDVPVLTQPPLLCIEVLSNDDTLRSLQERIDDYRTLGVPNIWVLDPVKRRAYTCQQGDFREHPACSKFNSHRFASPCKFFSPS